MKLLVKRILKYCVLLAFLANSHQLTAQESMMPEVSYTFLNKLIDTAYKYYPRQKTFEHRMNVSNELIKKAKLSWFDPFTFSYVYSPNNSTTLVNPSVLNGYQFGIFFNISSLLTKPASIRQAKEEALVNKYERETYLTNLMAEVKVRYFRYISQITQLRLRLSAANDAELLAKQSKFRFDKSEETFESYNRILLAYNDRRLTVIQSEAEMLIAKSYLEELVTKKLEDIN